VCSDVLRHDLSTREHVDIGAKEEESKCDLEKIFSERCLGRRFRPPDPARKHRKLLEHGSSIPAGSCRKAQEVGRNLSENLWS
jgi:hypothetical protein